jgi:8-oxo-dGTP pyrophosphatase MutT (NUDIX family)
MDKSWVLRLTEELTKPLPGIQVQQRMSPQLRRPVAADKPLRKSGVLFLLYPQDEGIHTVFIKRTEYEGIHSGQVSLPGGMFETGDGDLSYTAMREAMEETGVPVEKVKIIGCLTPLHIPVSNILVSPFIGVIACRPDFKPDPFEVQFLIEVSLHELSNPFNCKAEILCIGGNDTEVPYYNVQGNHIWGATAMMVSEFLEIYKSVIGDW